MQSAGLVPTQRAMITRKNSNIQLIPHKESHAFLLRGWAVFDIVASRHGMKHGKNP